VTNTQTLSLPMILPSGPDCARCLDRLKTELRSIKGVESAEIDSGQDIITVIFDPDSVTLSRIESEAKRAGAGIASRIEHRTLVLRDLDCPDCAATIEKAVNQLPGVLWAGANFAAGQMHAEFERGKVRVEDISRIVEQHGARACPLPGPDSASVPVPSSSIWIEHRKLIVTAVATLLTAGALLTGINALFAAAIVIGGWTTAKAALAALRTRVVDMNVLMTLAVIGAAGIGEWFEGATVVVLYNIGGLLQAFTVERTRRSIRALMDLSPKSARIRRGGIELDCALDQVGIGDTVLVKPGERIPIDGDITAGRTALNEAPITGESMPVEKGPGDSVFAGTLNGQSAIELTATHRYRDTTLARIIHKVEEAQAQRAPAQQFIDRFAAAYTPAVVLLALLVGTIPPLYVAIFTEAAVGPVWSEWFLRALSLLIISCPCALVISTPVAIVTALGLASRKGALIKGGAYLEEIGRVRAILYDKTGTLTTGRFEIEEVIPFDSQSADELLAIAAAVESRSEHPLAEAFVRAAKGLELPSVDSVEAVPGRGVQGTIWGRRFLLGNEPFLRENGIELDAVRGLLLSAEGRTPILLASEGRVLAAFMLADSLRPDAAQTIRALRNLGISRHLMLTGDRPEVAERISKAAGLDGFEAGLLPEDKSERVRKLRAEGSVAMIGDGINDAPAMAVSSVGITMGAAASDTALETADIAILGDDLAKLPFLVRLSRRTHAIIHQNVAVSLVTKGFLIAAALTIGLPLWLAVIGDVGVSLLVTLNGLRLLHAPESAP